MNNKFYSQLCIESYEGAKVAEKLGFNSIEINSSLFLGGITPSYGMLKKIADNINIEKIVMIRNRPAGFCYTDVEYGEMLDDLNLILNENIDGIAFGFLTEHFTIDEQRTKEFVDLIHAKGKKALFHRAFDNAIDANNAIELLIDLNVDYLLTSGQKETALEGRDSLQKLIKKYGNDIDIIAASGINANNVGEIIEHTNANFIHASCKTYLEDATTAGNVSYSLGSNMNNRYISIDENEARALIEKLQNLF
ncbi:MAG: copper homeostasis protein CutC [Tissierellia bacterium]|nr:copper homeostasis protein CutC [Tissierellia bacterium]